MSDVTIIIPNYNGKEDLLACLSSLERQTYPADLIVVDDGSTDESAEAVEAWRREREKASGHGTPGEKAFM